MESRREQVQVIGGRANKAKAQRTFDICSFANHTTGIEVNSLSQ